MKTNTIKKIEKPAPIETGLIAQLPTLQAIYSRDVERLMHLLLPRFQAQKFGRDLGVIGENCTTTGDGLTPASDAMVKLEYAIESLRLAQAEAFEFLVMACSRYRGDVPDGLGFAYALARDIRDAYVAFVDKALRAAAVS